MPSEQENGLIRLPKLEDDDGSDAVKSGVWLFYRKAQCPDCGQFYGPDRHPSHANFEDWLGVERIDFMVRSRKWLPLYVLWRRWPIAWMYRGYQFDDIHVKDRTLWELLQINGIRHLSDICRIGKHGLWQIKGIGPKRSLILGEILKRNGIELTLHGDTNPLDCPCWLERQDAIRKNEN